MDEHVTAIKRPGHHPGVTHISRYVYCMVGILIVLQRREVYDANFLEMLGQLVAAVVAKKSRASSYRQLHLLSSP